MDQFTSGSLWPKYEAQVVRLSVSFGENRPPELNFQGRHATYTV